MFWIRRRVGHWVWTLPPEAISGYAVWTRTRKLATLRDRWLWRRLARGWYLPVPTISHKLSVLKYEYMRTRNDSPDL